MTITLDGTLGITSPAETVQGALTTTGNTILGDATTDTLNVGAGGLVKDASGNVGIGTASPAFKLDVSGSAKIGSAYNDGLNIVVSGNKITYPADNTLAFSTNNTEQMRIDSAGLLKFNSGYGSVATAYGCRAWVNFNGTGTVAIRGSGNVSSITDNGTGNYTVNFTTAMVDINYSVSGGTSSNGTQAVTSFNIFGTADVSYTAPTTSAFRLQTTLIGAALVDTPYVMVSIFR